MNGPITRFAQVTGGQLRWLVVTDTSTGTSEEINLMTSDRTAWHFAPRTDGRGRDILLLACRPNFDPRADANASRLLYSRFTFERDGWRRYARVDPGFWESADEFPPRARFP